MNPLTSFTEYFEVPDEKENMKRCKEIRRFVRFGTICIIQKMWKTPTDECYFQQSSSVNFFELYKWYQIAQSNTND